MDPQIFVEVACKVTEGRPIERSRASSFDKFYSEKEQYHSVGLESGSFAS